MNQYIARLTDPRQVKKGLVTIKDIRNAYHIFQMAANPVHLISCLQTRHLLRTRETCETCSYMMSLVLCKLGHDGYVFKCKKCNQIKPLTKGTIFEKAKVGYEGVLLLLFSWACHIRGSAASVLYGMKLYHVIKQYQEFREVCTKVLEKAPIQLGGKHDIVEIDEKLFIRESKDKKQKPIQQFVVGMYSHEARRGFATLVDEINGAKLHALIQKHVLPGSTVWTNDYDELEGLTQRGYKHQTFQQSAGAHIEYLPEFWNDIKMYVNHNCRAKLESLTTHHLSEYLWMIKFGRTPVEAFHNMIQHITECYPLK